MNDGTVQLPGSSQHFSGPKNVYDVQQNLTSSNGPIETVPLSAQCARKTGIFKLYSEPTAQLSWTDADGEIPHGTVTVYQLMELGSAVHGMVRQGSNEKI
jgi:hypothetical protein